MKAVILESPEKLVYQDIDRPEPGPGEARVKLGAASICGSDMLRVFHGHAKVMPIVLGHEYAGVIDAVGEGVPAERIGQRVALAPLVPCMQCAACQRGLYASCKHYSFIGSRVNGGFAEYTLAPAQNLVPLPDDVDLEIGALIEPATVALHAIERGGGAEGKAVVVLGAGSIGLLTVQMARFKGASLVIATDFDNNNLEAARMFGADAVFNPAETDAVATVRDLTNGGVDLALEAAGSPYALADAIHMADADGHIVCVGNQPQDKSISLELIEHIMRQELNLHGTWMSYSAPFPGNEWTDAVQAMQQYGETLRAIISHRFDLRELPDTFRRIHDDRSAFRKVIVTGA